MNPNLAATWRWLLPLGILWAVPTRAQITPDTTLPVNSQVSAEGNTFSIEGGSTAGTHLFHSFSQFNVPTGSEAFFNNSPGIDNIITRVTGGQLSNIDGIIRANGTANLFLLNPSGIVFGPNARLDIGGSFFGSTAESLEFADGSLFSAAVPNAPPLLTINVPIGLQFGSNPGEILLQGTGHDLTVVAPIFVPIQRGSQDSGLRVNSGQTLALAGGNVTSIGGILSAAGGRIEIGSVENGTIDWVPSSEGWTLGYDRASTFGDIHLQDRSLLNASGFGGGSVQLVGANASLSEGSVILLQNAGDRNAGGIRIHTTEAIDLIGTTADGLLGSGLQSDALHVGEGGDIDLSTRQLSLLNGGSVATNAFSNGAAGNITIDATESLQIRDVSPSNPDNSSFLASSTLDAGQAGNITLSTQRLTVAGGGLLSSSTFGTGRGGNVTLNVTELTEVMGERPTLQQSLVAVTTLNSGNAGTLTLNTPRLRVREGGSIGSSAFSSGKAGNVVILARESVEVSGRGLGPFNHSTIVSSANLAIPGTQEFLRLPAVPTGNSGNLTISTDRLSVTDGALVNVRNEGLGNAGTLQIQANSIGLSDRSSITATSQIGQGGDINLQVPNLLILQDESEISTRSGTADTGGGNGGSISLNTTNLVILDSSHINANAFTGFGGNIQISAQGLFVSPNGQISASSRFGVDGTVEIQTPELDPSMGLVEFSAQPTDGNDLIVSGCTGDPGNIFAIVGHGGIPEDPTVTLRESLNWTDSRDWRELGRDRSVSAFVATTEPRQLVEATGWVRRPDGVVELVAAVPASDWESTEQCQSLPLTEFDGNGYNND